MTHRNPGQHCPKNRARIRMAAVYRAVLGHSPLGVAPYLREVAQYFGYAGPSGVHNAWKRIDGLLRSHEWTERDLLLMATLYYEPDWERLWTEWAEARMPASSPIMCRVLPGERTCVMLWPAGS